MTHKILILGSTGTVGQHLTELLLQKGESLKAATRNPESFPVQQNLEAVAFDYADPTTFDAALEGVDRLYAVSPLGVAQPFDLLSPVLKAAQARGIKIVLQTALGVDANDNIPLRRLELLLEQSGLPYVVLRPNYFVDNFHTYLAQDVAAGVIRVPAADAKTSFVDSRDIALSAAAALTHAEFDGRTFALTGPEGVSYAQAAQVLSDVSGRTIRYEATTPESYVQSRVEQGMPEDYAQGLAFIFGGVVQGWFAAPTEAVQELTGKVPYSVREYAEHNREKFVQSNPQA